MAKTQLNRLQIQKTSLVYTVSETADLLGICRTTVYELVQEKKLPHLKLGRRIVIPKAALEQMIGTVSKEFKNG